MRAWGRGALPINKMANWISPFSLSGYTHMCVALGIVPFSLCGYRRICVARGNVSWTRKDNSEVTELELWCHERHNYYYLYASKTGGCQMKVCKVIDVFTLHFQKCTDKIKTLLTKKSKFHFVQYWKQTVSCESTDKGVSSRGSRVRTKCCGSIIDSGSDRVLTMYHLTIIYTKPFLFKNISLLMQSP